MMGQKYLLLSPIATDVQMTLTPQEWLFLLLSMRTSGGAQFWCNVETLQMREHISRGRISVSAG